MCIYIYTCVILSIVYIDDWQGRQTSGVATVRAQREAWRQRMTVAQRRGIERFRKWNQDWPIEQCWFHHRKMVVFHGIKPTRMMSWMGFSIGLCQDSHWKLRIEVVSFPIHSMVTFHSYVSLPEGIVTSADDGVKSRWT